MKRKTIRAREGVFAKFISIKIEVNSKRLNTSEVKSRDLVRGNVRATESDNIIKIKRIEA